MPLSYGQTENISDITSNLIPPSGKKFAGWKVTINGKDFWTCNDNNSCTLTAPSDPITFGSDHVDLYAQWTNKIYMQDITEKQCQDLASSSNYTVYDRRDESDYTIRYFQSPDAQLGGYCWMMQNLRITGWVPAEGSNFTMHNRINKDKAWYDNNNKMINVSSESLEDYSSSTDPVSFKSDEIKYGAWYNLCAATAGTKCPENSSTTIRDDICPSGWQMPTDGDIAYALFGQTLDLEGFSPSCKNFSFDCGNRFVLFTQNTWSGIYKDQQWINEKEGYGYGKFWWGRLSTKSRSVRMSRSSSRQVVEILKTDAEQYGLSIRCVLKKWP